MQSSTQCLYPSLPHVLDGKECEPEQIPFSQCPCRNIDAGKASPPFPSVPSPEIKCVCGCVFAKRPFSLCFCSAGNHKASLPFPTAPSPGEESVGSGNSPQPPNPEDTPVDTDGLTQSTPLKAKDMWAARLAGESAGLLNTFVQATENQRNRPILTAQYKGYVGRWTCR